jgi:hypothetical protein
MLSLLSINFLYAESYAVLISGGFAKENEGDDPEIDSYWYDLFLVYEYLIEHAGYTHNNVIVFFGDGSDWDATTINNYRYNVSQRYPSWPDIVDYANNMTTIETQITNFANNVITDQDNLLIWFPRGHGHGNISDADQDNGMAMIEQEEITETWYISEYDDFFVDELIIYDILNFKDANDNNQYKRKKVIVSACRSGHFVAGNKTLLNGGDQNNNDDNSTIAMTTCSWNQTGIHNTINNEKHSGFTYCIYCTLMNEDPWGNSITWDQSNPNYSPDTNDDGVISLQEIYDTIKYGAVEYCCRKSWESGSEPKWEVRPQIADPCPMADYLYIDEILKIKNATLNLMQDETERYYWVDKIIAAGDGNDLIIPDNSDIRFVVDSEVSLQSGFHAQSGAEFHAYIGEVSCP